MLHKDKEFQELERQRKKIQRQDERTSQKAITFTVYEEHK